MIEKKKNKFLFVNLLTKRGNKYRGEKLLLKCIKKNQKEEKKVFLELFKNAIRNIIVSFKPEKFKKQKKKPKVTLIFLINRKRREMKAMKEIVSATTRQTSLSGHQGFLKQENKIIFALKESINLPENFLYVAETYETLLSQKKYSNKFKWR